MTVSRSRANIDCGLAWRKHRPGRRSQQDPRASSRAGRLLAPVTVAESCRHCPAARASSPYRRHRRTERRRPCGAYPPQSRGVNDFDVKELFSSAFPIQRLLAATAEVIGKKRNNFNLHRSAPLRLPRRRGRRNRSVSSPGMSIRSRNGHGRRKQLFPGYRPYDSKRRSPDRPRHYQLADQVRPICGRTPGSRPDRKCSGCPRAALPLRPSGPPVRGWSAAPHPRGSSMSSNRSTGRPPTSRLGDHELAGPAVAVPDKNLSDPETGPGNRCQG